MEQRGRKSKAELAVVKNSEISAINRPEPPENLSKDEAHEWITVVNAESADWFKDSQLPVLERYCCHVVQARLIKRAIDSLMKSGGENWLEDYDKLLRMHEREGRAILACARTMRLTHQAQYSHKKKRSGGAVYDKPFD